MFNLYKILFETTVRVFVIYADTRQQLQATCAERTSITGYCASVMQMELNLGEN